MAGSIGFDGLASGLDSGRIIEQLLELERRPVRLLESQLAGVRATHGAIDTLAGKLAALRQVAVALQAPSSAPPRTAVSSEPTVLGVAAGPGAEPGVTTVSVLQVARPSVARATIGVPAPDVAIGAADGVLRFQVGAAPAVEVVVGATTTLEDLAASVNALDAGVTARVVNVGASDAPSYRLHVTSDATGVARSIVVLQDDTTLGLATESGANAVVTLDDLGVTVERDTNTVSDLVPGLTLTVRATGTAVVTVADDAGAVAARAQALVGAYNELRRFVASAATVTTTDDALAVGPLAADGTARGAMHRLQQALAAEVPGFGRLASLGITTARDGTLTLDDAKLGAALAAGAGAVAGTLAGAAGAVVGLVDDLTKPGGALELRTAALDARERRLDASILAAERRVDQVEAGLRRQFQALETLLASLQQQSRGLAAIVPATASA